MKFLKYVENENMKKINNWKLHNSENCWKFEKDKDVRTFTNLQRMNLEFCKNNKIQIFRNK